MKKFFDVLGYVVAAVGIVWMGIVYPWGVLKFFHPQARIFDKSTLLELWVPWMISLAVAYIIYGLLGLLTKGRPRRTISVQLLFMLAMLIGLSAKGRKDLYLGKQEVWNGTCTTIKVMETNPRGRLYAQTVCRAQLVSVMNAREFLNEAIEHPGASVHCRILASDLNWAECKVQ